MIREGQIPPSPLEWHPAYREKTYLIDWLNRVGHLANKEVVQYYDYRLESLAERIEKGPFGSTAFTVKTLTRQKCWGPAPYTGRPFIYMWFAAVDELGRGIAGESWQEFMPWSVIYNDWQYPGFPLGERNST